MECEGAINHLPNGPDGQQYSDFERSNVQNVLFFSSFSEPFGIRIKDSTGQFEFQIVCNDSSVKFSRRVNGGEWSQCWSK